MSGSPDYSLHVFRSPKLRGVVDDAVRFLFKTPVHNLPPPETFNGPGVYALFYAGNFELYAPLARADRSRCRLPIYVGKAVPPGWRTARAGDMGRSGLHVRLTEHAKSIEQAKNLDSLDFRCRFVILSDDESDLIGAVEARLIRDLAPLWNAVVDGFGNHDPGSGRYRQATSEWDVLHPGRYWVDRLTGNPPDLDPIVAEVRRSLSALTPP